MWEGGFDFVLTFFYFEDTDRLAAEDLLFIVFFFM